MPTLPITVPNTFANATSNIALSLLDADFQTVAQAINGIGNGSTPLTGVTITGFSPSGTYTPTDASGAGLAFINPYGYYQRFGNIVIATGALTYPATTNTNLAKINLPVLIPAQGYAQSPFIVQIFHAGGSATPYIGTPGAGTASFLIYVQNADNYIQNLSLSGLLVSFTAIYPAT